MSKDKNNRNIFAMIPARMGSQRLPMKNLALLNGKPLIFYAVSAAKKAGCFQRIFVNSEHNVFSDLAKRYKVDFYQRPASLANSNTKSDLIVYDFIKKNPCDIVVWVNPTSPLQSVDEIVQIVKYFIIKNLDTLITVKDEPVHCIYKGKPVNFRPKELFSRTQDLTPVQPFVYSIMMWRTDIFKLTFERKGFAFFCGKVGFYSISKISSIIIKKKEDLMLAEFLLRLIAKKQCYKVRYDNIIKKLRNKKMRPYE